MKEIDELTIRMAAKKNAEAFKRIYDHYSMFVWKVIFRTVNGNGDAAKEVVQETFLRVYMSLKSFSFNSALSTWIYRIAFNTATTYVIKEKGKYFFTNIEVETVADAGRSNSYEDRELVKMLLSQLTPEERFLITSREVEGIPFEELAQITGRSSQSLRTQVSRLKEKLRTTFEQRFP
jgi:RNA polymerase sigma-70 factor, ECF subfamily